MKTQFARFLLSNQYGLCGSNVTILTPLFLLDKKWQVLDSSEKETGQKKHPSELSVQTELQKPQYSYFVCTKVAKIFI